MYCTPSVISLWDSEMENQFLSVKPHCIISLFILLFHLYATIKSGCVCKNALICVKLACTINLLDDEMKIIFYFTFYWSRKQIYFNTFQTLRTLS